MHERVKHLDLKEIAARLDPNRPPSARGKMYYSTEPGRSDFGLMCVVFILIDLFKDGCDKSIRISEIDSHASIKTMSDVRSRIPASVKRLAKLKQLTIDFDREGAFVKKGPSWIET